MSDNGQEAKWLNTLLSPREAAEFDAIQRYHGIRTNSDVVRYLIRQEHRRIRQLQQAAESPA